MRTQGSQDDGRVEGVVPATPRPLPEFGGGQISSPTRALATHAASAAFDDLAGHDVSRLTSLVIDAVGCALGAQSLEQGRIYIDYARGDGCAPRSTLLGTSVKSSTKDAAWANAVRPSGSNSRRSRTCGRRSAARVRTRLRHGSGSRIRGVSSRVGSDCSLRQPLAARSWEFNCADVWSRCGCREATQFGQRCHGKMLRARCIDGAHSFCP
jgi:hypothetical protein